MKFKKSIAALLAAVMVIGMVSCGSTDSDDDDDDEEESKITTTTTAAETTTEAEEPDTTAEVTEEPETTTTEAETEDPADTENSSDTETSEAEEGYADGVYTGTGYTIEVDESLWEYSEQAGTDCAFTYIGEGDDMAATANLNVVSMAGLTDLSPSDYAESMEEVYASMEGYTVSTSEKSELNGYEAYNFSISYEISEYTMIINQIILSENGTLVAISYGAFDSVMDDMQPEFDKILETFSFN